MHQKIGPLDHIQPADENHVGTEHLSQTHRVECGIFCRIGQTVPPKQTVHNVVFQNFETRLFEFGV